MHPWVTLCGTDPLPLEEEHCTVVEVTEEEVQNSVKLIPSLSTVVSVSASLGDTHIIVKKEVESGDKWLISHFQGHDQHEIKH